MNLLRRHCCQRRVLAACLLAAVLLMRLLVPAGYMVSSDAGMITLTPCSGYGPIKPAAVVSEQHHQHHHEPVHSNEHGKSEQPCGFAVLSAPSLAGTDPILLVLALAFILAVRKPVAPIPRPQPFLRPPLRGPPAPS